MRPLLSRYLSVFAKGAWEAKNEAGTFGKFVENEYDGR